MKRLIVALGVAVLAASANAVTPSTAQAVGGCADGRCWDEVCCGAACEIEYCNGNGRYACCKADFTD